MRVRFRNHNVVHGQHGDVLELSGHFFVGGFHSVHFHQPLCIAFELVEEWLVNVTHWAVIANPNDQCGLDAGYVCERYSDSVMVMGGCGGNASMGMNGSESAALRSHTNPGDDGPGVQ